MRHTYLRKLIAFTLTLTIILGLPGTALAASGESSALTWEKLDGVSARLIGGQEVVEADTSVFFADTDVVRAIITLDKPSVLQKLETEGQPTADLYANRDAMRYQDDLLRIQNNVAADISRNALNGEPLDVVWNLTLAANAISVNVPYGTLEAIKEVDGVSGVSLSMRYEPLETDPQNVVAKTMTGVTAVQSDSSLGYTGAGTRIAVIDTGTDTDHQSFDNDAYLYSLALNAKEKGMDYDDYIQSLDMLDVDEIAAVLTKLHAYERYEGLTAEDLFLSEKLPFAFNYVDKDLDVTHDKDQQGEHGSHVAGIAAANRYIAPIGDVDCDNENYDFDDDGEVTVSDAFILMDYVLNGGESPAAAYADVDGDSAVTTHDVTALLDGMKTLAEDAVGVVGVAPDAQLITMKVFGKDGGAYADDYVAALEDALLLGCDVANMSLGAATAGWTSLVDPDEGDADLISRVFDVLSGTDMVVTVSAGNSGNWADNDDAYGYMYTDEGGTANVSHPSTYVNSLSVASADNVGSVSSLQTACGSAIIDPLDGIVYQSDPNDPTADPVDVTEHYWSELASDEGTEYEVVFLGDPTGLFSGGEQTDQNIYGGTAAAFEGCDCTGKVVFIARGGSEAGPDGVTGTEDDVNYTFTDKHLNGYAAGARAVIVYDNRVEAPFYANLLDSTNAIPCATITLEEALAVFAEATPDENGVYTATLTVTSGLFVDEGEGEKVTMSDFSSWGTTSALTIKPEITAPGGNIYSVNGMDPDGDGYESMSGTSMAAPHIAGMTALLAQHIDENGLVETAGVSRRVLAQSLLMSTAVPLVEDDVEYSVRSQGAGLADLMNAVTAETYVMVDGQDDGKVKAELGDDPERTGVYTFSFTVNNLTGAAQTYRLSESILSTDTYPVEGADYKLAANAMTALDHEAAYTGDGVEGNTVTVPANGSANVTVTIRLTDEAKASRMADGYTNGFYVEGYVYLNAKGDTKVSHSIPLLGWYGNWTDISMYDLGDFIEYFNYMYGDGVEPERPSHLDHLVTGQGLDGSIIQAWLENIWTYSPAGFDQGYYYSGNVYNQTSEGENDGRYLPERNAINPDGTWDFYAIFPSLIRNAAAFRISAVDAETGEVFYEETYEDEAIYGSFYYAAAGYIYDTTSSYGIGFAEDWDYTDSEGQPLEPGTRIRYQLTMLPEYYRDVNDQGEVFYHWELAGQGATLSWDFTLDAAAPELDTITLSEDGNTLNYTVADENYVAAVVLLDGAGTSPLKYNYPDQDADQKGKSVSGSFDISSVTDRKLVIAVCDYAGNESYYAINRGGEGASYGSFLAFQYDIMDGYYHNWVAFDANVNEDETTVFASTNMEFACAEYVNGWVFAQAANGNLYAISEDDFTGNLMEPNMILLKHLDNVYQDLAYNYYDGNLYGVFQYDDTTTYVNVIYLEEYAPNMWETYEAFSENWAAGSGNFLGYTLAIDDEGSIYVLGLEQTTDYDTWETTTAETFSLWKCSLVEEWGDIYYTPFEKVADSGIKADYRQSMTWDHNDETLYWARFDVAGLFDEDSDLYKITYDAEADAWTFDDIGDLSSETGALMAPLTAETRATHTNVPDLDSSEVGRPTLDQSALTLLPGATYQFSWGFDPWYTGHTDVVWSSADETVCTVDANGLVTAVSPGAAVVTVAAKDNETLTAECTVTVAALNVKVSGIASGQLYNFSVTNGITAIEYTGSVTDPLFGGEYGLSLGESTAARGCIYGMEYDNSGIIYKMDESGEILEWFQPIDGDMMFGLGYSEETNLFAGIMNYYFFPDVPLTDDKDYEKEMLGSYDEETHQFTWHRLDMSEYLADSDEGFSTGEAGNGSIVDVVLCGITAIDNTEGTQQYLYGDYRGQGWYESCYTPVTTWVLMDNVGRFWYVDEIQNMTLEPSYWGNGNYTNANGEMISADTFGVMSLDNGDGTYNVFVIRALETTPLYDMYWSGTMPRITYHFSDLYHTVDTETGRDIFFLSLFDYWNQVETNELYMYVPGVPTGEIEYDEHWNVVPVKTPDLLFHLGDTGYPIASILSAEYIDGVDLTVPEPDEGDDEGGDWNWDWGTLPTLPDVYRK